MGLFDIIKNIFADGESASSKQPKIRMGRYSDNNKTLVKTSQWHKAEQLFNEKKYTECIELFFDYLRDDEEENVVFTKANNEYTFEIYQGTKIVKGSMNEKGIVAKVSLAKMEQASIPVMRRLLEMNFSLYYSRYALENNKLCMLFDTPLDMASPNKLYYGLKELATKADKQDDLLVTDFSTLKAIDDSHVIKFSEQESEVKYLYFKKWIDETISKVESLNQDTFSGGIAYMWLTLVYKLDFFISPEGKLMNELEKINIDYWSNKEEKTSVERNQLLKESFVKLSQWSKEEVQKYFYKAKSTFAITFPKSHLAVVDSIKGANENMLWYKENKHTDIAISVMEYGISFCQYSYSLPNTTTELFTLYMQINYNDFFTDLGYIDRLFSNNEFKESLITQKINKIITNGKQKFPMLKFDTQKLNFTSLIEFNFSFLQQLMELNFENN